MVLFSFIVGLYTTPTPGIADNTYDAALSCASFVVGHVQVEAVSELARIVKPDGFIIIIIHDAYFKLDYMTKIGELMKSGVVDMLSMEFIPYKREYRLDFEFTWGYLVVFKVKK